MKKLIIILLFIPFCLSLSAQEKPIKKWEHPIGGFAVSSVVFWSAYSATKDEDFSWRLAYIVTPLVAVGKESFDVLVVPNGEFSFKDAGISTAVGIATAALNRQICKWIKNKKSKKQTFKDHDKTWSLDNKFINNIRVN